MDGPIGDFATTRLTVSRSDARLADPARRAVLCETLARMLTPAVLRHLPPQLAETEDMEAWIDARCALSRVWLVEEGGALVSLLFLGADGQGGWRLGYLLGEGFWGRGLASELVGAVVGGWPGDAGVIHAGVTRDNAVSARVLLKAGFDEAPEDVP
jgi:ribosomal-protein-alanine N-acetyltransferase